MSTLPFAWILSISAGFLAALAAVGAAVLRTRVPGERVLIVGNGSLARAILRKLQECGGRTYRVVGVAGDGQLTGWEGADGSSEDPQDGLESIVERTVPDRIVVAMAERRGALPVRSLLELRMRGIAIEEGLEFYERLTGKLDIESLAPSSLIFSSKPRRSAIDRLLARGLSLLVSAIGLVGLVPLLAALALAIKLDSRGRVLFVQDRIGLRGRRFSLLKFRTMHPADGPRSEWARDNSDRVTPLGKWLRKYRLDELPQFLNVLRGDMNLVGPRPHPVSNFELFVEKIPYYWLRCTVRPGLTGWAQVRYGYANDLVEETEKVRYDLYYVKHRSLWLDLRILAETVRVVLLGREEPRLSLAGVAEPAWAAEGRSSRAESSRPRSAPMRVPVWKPAHAASRPGGHEGALHE